MPLTVDELDSVYKYFMHFSCEEDYLYIQQTFRRMYLTNGTKKHKLVKKVEGKVVHLPYYPDDEVENEQESSRV